MQQSPPPKKFRVESHRPPEKGCTKNQWGVHRVHQVEVLDSCHWQADTVEKIRMFSKRTLARCQGKPLLSRTSLCLSVMKQYFLWTRAWSSRKRIRLDYSWKLQEWTFSFFFLRSSTFEWRQHCRLSSWSVEAGNMVLCSTEWIGNLEADKVTVKREVFSVHYSWWQWQDSWDVHLHLLICWSDFFFLFFLFCVKLSHPYLSNPNCPFSFHTSQVP